MAEPAGSGGRARPSLVDVEAERLAYGVTAVRGEPERPAAADRCDPLRVPEAYEQRLARDPRQVGAALGPVDAGPGQRATGRGGQIGLERFLEPRPALSGQRQTVAGETSALDQDVSDRYGEPSGQMVIAGTGEGHRLVNAVRAQ